MHGRALCQKLYFPLELSVQGPEEVEVEEVPLQERLEPQLQAQSLLEGEFATERQMGFAQNTNLQPKNKNLKL
jgi:hypothetical protein